MHQKMSLDVRLKNVEVWFTMQIMISIPIEANNFDKKLSILFLQFW